MSGLDLKSKMVRENSHGRKNIPAYNKEMAALYRKCAWVVLVTSILCVFSAGIGVIFLCVECIVGIYIVYVCYSKILKKYSGEGQE